MFVSLFATMQICGAGPYDQHLMLGEHELTDHSQSLAALGIFPGALLTLKWSRSRFANKTNRRFVSVCYFWHRIPRVKASEQDPSGSFDGVQQARRPERQAKRDRMFPVFDLHRLFVSGRASRYE
ncbi:hypothetical protein K0M31_015479 [Melipona bicolor]|uniref:Uncharacterized protein n=1 Tax=Melipona bicolor TaxID=60889 RepID=A0AA40FFJ0_9HYME|nr:hypothetical protein K0M31_015479 [Melipona bicolor]